MVILLIYCEHCTTLSFLRLRGVLHSVHTQQMTCMSDFSVVICLKELNQNKVQYILGFSFNNRSTRRYLFLSFSLVVDHHPKETLLHLAVRLGLAHLARFLIHQPRGQRALTLPNLEGDTPLQLAQRDAQHAMFRVLAA